jgi:hypothetical protein
MACGGACLDVRSDPAHCGSCARSCPMGACVDGQCACQDGSRNGTETDVDCGGGCAPCGAGKRCTLSKDCATGFGCLSGRCWPNNNLVAWYDLEQSPPNVLDGSGNGNTGTVVGATPTPGKVGNGYRFGAGTCIRAPDSASLGMSGATGLTIMAWVNYTGGCAPGFIRATVLLKENSYGLALVCASQELQTGVGTTAGAFNLAGTKPVTTNAWHLAAVTWDGAVSRRYIDAVEVETEAIAGTMTKQATGLGVGCRQVTASGDNGSGASFVGIIDEVAIYSRALTPKEIQDYYAITR